MSCEFLYISSNLLDYHTSSEVICQLQKTSIIKMKQNKTGDI